MRQIVVAILAAMVTCFVTSSAQAQGSIFGVVQNTDLSHPDTGALRWVGFLDNTDEEIRIETNAGAGYDGANWFDDFQNYTTEAAGNPYDFHFVNETGCQAYHLEKTIPASGFQQEDVTLTPYQCLDRPTGLRALVSGTSIRVSWVQETGLTYHVYRRHTSNNGTFRRIDDPTGNLANPGVADSVLIDATWDGVNPVTYLLIAEDASGNYSSHSDEAAASSCDCLCHADPECDGVADVLDVVGVVSVAFRGGDPLVDPGCPRQRSDVNCDGFTDVLDVVRIVEVVFRGGNPAVNFCIPCA